MPYETGFALLITRRSQVQILPPLPMSSQARGPLADARGPLSGCGLPLVAKSVAKRGG